MLGQTGVATMTVAGPKPVVVLEVQLLGAVPSLPTRVVGTDLRLVRALGFTPERSGTFGVEVRGVDVAGCRATTAGQIRNVIVKP